MATSFVYRQQPKAGTWAEEEDELLSQWQAKLGNKWSAIAKHIPGRSGQQCAQRWRHKVNPNITHDHWTPEEDATLALLVDKHGRHWAEIARHFKGRSDQQCMGRWRRHLDPSIRKDKWTGQEDQQLQVLYRKYGNSWSAVAKCIASRTPHQCRARWHRLKACRAEQGLMTPEACAPASFQVGGSCPPPRRSSRFCSVTSDSGTEAPCSAGALAKGHSELSSGADDVTSQLTSSSGDEDDVTSHTESYQAAHATTKAVPVPRRTCGYTVLGRRCISYSTRPRTTHYKPRFALRCPQRSPVQTAWPRGRRVSTCAQQQVTCSAPPAASTPAIVERPLGDMEAPTPCTIAAPAAKLLHCKTSEPESERCLAGSIASTSGRLLEAPATGMSRPSSAEKRPRPSNAPRFCSPGTSPAAAGLLSRHQFEQGLSVLGRLRRNSAPSQGTTSSKDCPASPARPSLGDPAGPCPQAAGGCSPGSPPVLQPFLGGIPLTGPDTAGSCRPPHVSPSSRLLVSPTSSMFSLLQSPAGGASSTGDANPFATSHRRHSTPGRASSAAMQPLGSAEQAALPEPWHVPRMIGFCSPDGVGNPGWSEIPALSWSDWRAEGNGFGIITSAAQADATPSNQNSSGLAASRFGSAERQPACRRQGTARELTPNRLHVIQAMAAAATQQAPVMVDAPVRPAAIVPSDILNDQDVAHGAALKDQASLPWQRGWHQPQPPPADTKLASLHGIPGRGGGAAGSGRTMRVARRLDQHEAWVAAAAVREAEAAAASTELDDPLEGGLTAAVAPFCSPSKKLRILGAGAGGGATLADASILSSFANRFAGPSAPTANLSELLQAVTVPAVAEDTGPAAMVEEASFGSASECSAMAHVSSFVFPSASPAFAAKVVPLLQPKTMVRFLSQPLPACGLRAPEATEAVCDLPNLLGMGAIRRQRMMEHERAEGKENEAWGDMAGTFGAGWPGLPVSGMVVDRCGVRHPEALAQQPATLRIPPLWSIGGSTEQVAASFLHMQRHG